MAAPMGYINNEEPIVFLETICRVDQSGDESDESPEELRHRVALRITTPVLVGICK